MRCSSVLLSATAFFVIAQAIPAEAPWEPTSEAEVDKEVEEPTTVSAHIEPEVQHGTSETSAVGIPVMAVPETTSSEYSAVGVPQIATPSPTQAPTTLITSAYAAITSCTTFHMEADPYKPVTSCTTYHKENNGGNGNNQVGPTTTTTSAYGAITSCTTFHMEADPYKPITSCTTYHNENSGNKQEATTVTTKTTQTVSKPAGSTNNAVAVREFCTSLYGNFTWCYSAADTKPDPNRFPSCNEVGCVLPATYTAQLFKPAKLPDPQPKDYAPWASGPEWTQKVFAAQANIIVATLWTTEWLMNYTLYKTQASIFNETATQFQGQSFYKISIDDKDVASKWSDFSIRRLPTYVFYRAGAELGRLEGFQTAKQLQDKMKSFVK